MNILKNIFKFKNNKVEEEEEAYIASSPYSFVESMLPNAEFAAEISRINLADFNEDKFYRDLFTRVKHAILTKLEYSPNKRAIVIFVKNDVDDSKLTQYVKSPLINLGYTVNITKKPNKDNDYIPYEHWIEITW